MEGRWSHSQAAMATNSEEDYTQRQYQQSDHSRGPRGMDYSLSTKSSSETSNTYPQDWSNAVANYSMGQSTNESSQLQANPMAQIPSVAELAAQYHQAYGDFSQRQHIQPANHPNLGLDYSLPTRVTNTKVTANSCTEDWPNTASTEPQQFNTTHEPDPAMAVKASFADKPATEYEESQKAASTEPQQSDKTGEFDSTLPSIVTKETLNKCSDISQVTVSPTKASAVTNRPAMNTKSSQSVILKLHRLHCKQVNIQETEASVIIECTKSTKEWFMLDHLTNSKLNTVDATGDMHNKAIYATVDSAVINFTALKSQNNANDDSFNNEDEQDGFDDDSGMQKTVKIEPMVYEVDGPEHTAIDELILNRQIKVELRDIPVKGSLKRKRKVGVQKTERKKRQRLEVVASNLISSKKGKQGKVAAAKDKDVKPSLNAGVKDEGSVDSDSTVVGKTEENEEEEDDGASEIDNNEWFFSGLDTHFCDLCHRGFKTKAKLKRHTEQIHQMIKPYSCEKCDKDFIWYRELQVHQRTHEDAEPFSCEICGLTTKQYRKIERHIKDVHTGKKAFTCSICLKPFAYEASLAEHKFTHPPEEEKPHQCELCDARFLHAVKLQRHMNTHMKAQDNVCPVCNKQFKKMSVLRQHQLSHTDEKRFLCDKCGKAFKSPQTVAKHKKAVHFGLKPYCCLTCGKLFATSYSYSRHMMIHTGEKPYICDFCGVACNDLSNLKKHKQSHKI